jgi:hypothetical protein
MHVTRITDQILASEDNVIFDSIPTAIGGCGISLPSSDIYIWEPGYYHVYFNIYHLEPCQFTMFLNNLPEIDTIVGSPTGAAQNSSSAILYVSSAAVLVNPTSLSPIGTGAIVNFRNHTSFAPLITLNGQSGSGSATPQIVAVVVLFKLGA